MFMCWWFPWTKCDILKWFVLSNKWSKIFSLLSYMSKKNKPLHLRSWKWLYIGNWCLISFNLKDESIIKFLSTNQLINNFSSVWKAHIHYLWFIDRHSGKCRKSPTKVKMDKTEVDTSITFQITITEVWKQQNPQSAGKSVATVTTHNNEGKKWERKEGRKEGTNYNRIVMRRKETQDKTADNSEWLTSQSRREPSRSPAEWPPHVWWRDWSYWGGGRSETTRPLAGQTADLPQS